MTRLLKISTLAVLFVGLLVGLAVGVSGCNSVKPGKPNNEQLAALDEAYKSGVFTKEEYDAKKAAIVAASAASATPATSAAPPVSSTQAPPPDSSGSTPIASAEPAPVPAFPEPSLPPQAAPVPQPAPPPQPQPAPVKTPPAPKPTTVARAASPTTSQAKISQPEQTEPEPAPSRQCEDAEYKAHKNGPQERFFPAPVARVKKAVLSALTNLDFTVHKDSGDEIEASKNRHIGVVVGAGGEREILHFEAAKQGGQSGTLVTGETKKSVVGRLAQKSWTGAVLAETACTLRK